MIQKYHINFNTPKKSVTSNVISALKNIYNFLYTVCSKCATLFARKQSINTQQSPKWIKIASQKPHLFLRTFSHITNTPITKHVSHIFGALCILLVSFIAMSAVYIQTNTNSPTLAKEFTPPQIIQPEQILLHKNTHKSNNTNTVPQNTSYKVSYSQVGRLFVVDQSLEISLNDDGNNAAFSNTLKSGEETIFIYWDRVFTQSGKLFNNQECQFTIKDSDSGSTLISSTAQYSGGECIFSFKPKDQIGYSSYIVEGLIRDIGGQEYTQTLTFEL